MLISGSVDKTVKIVKLGEERVIKTLFDFDHVLVTVKFV